MRGNALGQDRRGRLRLSFDARAGSVAPASSYCLKG